MSDIGLDSNINIGLDADLNKQKGDEFSETRQGVASEKLSELSLSMSDEDIIELTTKWKSAWDDSAKKKEWEKQIKENEEYWMGKQFDIAIVNQSRPPVDNLIFESVETYLPQTTRRNPEPLIAIHSKSKSDEPNPIHEKFVEKVKERLTDLADDNKLRLKLKKAARHWAIYQLGIGKFGWDLDKDMPILRIIRPKLIILDPDSNISEDGYTGDRVGELRTMTASRILAVMGEDASKEGKKKINELSKDSKATDIRFIEWWTPEFMAWTIGRTVLLKKKNPHWNYDTPEVEGSVDGFGNESEPVGEIKGLNHLPVPKMPYVFLSVFNLGDQPMDKTGLIQQNLANQDLINKRNRQIDKNADKMNGGAVVSLERSGLTKPQAKNVVRAIRDGGAVLIPSGRPEDAISFPKIPSLPTDVYQQLLDTRGRFRDIFGTSGSTPAGVKEEKTVRGKIQIRGLDTDRIGGGVSEYLEQFADDIYNWFVQLLYVYDTDFQFIEGAEPPRITVSVKEGSLLPKDSTSIANQALELASMGKISNIDLYKRLEYPNPEDLAANVWLEENAPHILYKDNQQVQEALQLMQQSQQQEEQKEAQETANERQHDMNKEQVKQQAKERDAKASRSALSSIKTQ